MLRRTAYSGWGRGVARPFFRVAGLVVALALTALAAPSSAQTYTATASPNPAAVGRVIYGCWTAPPGSPEFDWIVLVPAGSPSTDYVSLGYTGGTTSGCVALYTPAPGSYDVRYLLEGTFTAAATSSPVTAIVSPISVSITATPTTVVSGRQVYACWAAAPGETSSTDGVGLFAALLPTTALATQGTLGAENGCAAFTVPATGDYEVRYLAGGSLDIAAQTATTVPSPGAYSLTASAISGPSGLDAEACWTAPPGSPLFDWIVLVPLGAPSSAYISVGYTGGAASGCVTLNPGAPGLYEARYLLENGFTDVSTSNEIALGTTGSWMHAHEWKVQVTSDPQNHPQLDIGDEVTMLSYAPRPPTDGQPADPTIGDYGTGFVRLGSAQLDPPWTFGSPQPKFTVYDGFASNDGVRFDAAANGRSVAISCLTNPSRYANDGFKTRDMPVPVLDCPGAANDVTLQDSSPAAVVSGDLMCTRYLPEPTLGLALAAGCLALSTAVGSRRGRKRPASAQEDGRIA